MNQRNAKSSSQSNPRRRPSESDLDNISVKRTGTKQRRTTDPTRTTVGKPKANRSNNDRGKDTNKRTSNMDIRPKKNGKENVRRKKKKRMSTGKTVGIIIAAIIVVLLISAVAFAANKLSKLKTQKLNADTLEMNISEEAELSGEGYLNVAILGTDSREGTNADLDGSERTDSIMIASLNQETGDVKIVSVYRDTLAELDDGSYNKINAAYAYGGLDETISTLNRNLDMNIQNYVMVNFSALVDVIDALGGVELTLTDEEVYWINEYYLPEMIDITGVNSDKVAGAGTQTLNGIQATCYCRIRYTEGDDYKRAERQRTVLQLIADKAKTANILTLNKIIDAVLPKVSTSFSTTDILYYAKLAAKLNVAETTGFPFELTTGNVADAGDSVIATTMESNVIQLHQYLFGADGYTPSSIVSGISGNIAYYASSAGVSTDTGAGYSDGTNQNYTDQTNAGETYTDPGYTDSGTDQNYTDNTQTGNSDVY
ncbi:MAG: LCP family protein [Hespellia sp.]|nr:LCP family protein [Hespellia sp.]